MQIGTRGIQLIKEYERFRPNAYHATNYEKVKDIWTIGYGHTKDVKGGDTITRDEAEKLFKKDLTIPEHLVNRLLVPLTQSMYDALVSLAYNVPDALSSEHSQVVRCLRAKKYEKASLAITLYRTQNGTVLTGLVRRREAERKLFLEDGLEI